MLDLRALLLDERCVLHPRWTCRHARETPETAIEMLHERRGCFDASLDAGLHQVNASARRVHLLAPEKVGRARRQAEAAVHAFIDQRGRWRVVGHWALGI